MPKADAVTVAYVHSEEVAHSWQSSLLNLIGYDLANRGRVAEGGWIAVRCGTDGLVAARNWAVERFLADDKADWLWWVDTDMGFAPDTVDRLLASADPVERPIVGGLCFASKGLGLDGMGGYRNVALPTIMHWRDGQFVGSRQYPMDQVVRCAGTGSACVLIHRSVLEAVADKYGPTWYDKAPSGADIPSVDAPARSSSGRYISEDLSFCVRAGSLGFPVHVDTSVKTTHLKPVWLAEDDYLQQQFLESLAGAEDKAELIAGYRDTATSEGRWTAPRVDCPHPERWHSADPDSTEFEVTELVAAMVTALQPDFVVETGAAFGQTAEAIGRALQRAGQGRLVSLEVDPGRVASSRARCEGLPVEVLQMPSLDYTPDAPVDFAFFDSLVDLRPEEFRRYLPHMHARTVVGFHDTGPQHRVRDLLRPLEEEGLITPLYLPTPRGVCFARVNL